MTVREFVQQRRNQQLAEGSRGRGKTQRALMRHYNPLFRALGIARSDRSKFAIDPRTGLMRTPAEIIHHATGDELNARERHDAAVHYTSQALEKDPKGFKELVQKQALRNEPRTKEFIDTLATDMDQHLRRIDAAHNILQRDDPTNQDAINRLHKMRGDIEDVVLHHQPLHRLRQLVPHTSVKPSPVRNFGSIPQSHYLQSRLHQNIERRKERGAEVPTDSDS